MTAKPKIAIIGDGNVGGALAQGLLRTGYAVRTTGNDALQVKQLGAWGDVIVIAVPFSEVGKVIDGLGAAVKGKAVLDVTNAIGPDGAYAMDLTKSGAERMQERVQGAHVVKAFNMIFAQNMSTGKVNGHAISNFVAGDDVGAKAKVLQMAKDIGFDAVDAGPLKNARWLETFGMFNIALGYGVGMGPGIGFKLVR